MSLAMAECREWWEEEPRVEHGEADACDTNHPVIVSGVKDGREVVDLTYIPSSSKNSVSLRIKGLPQPPAISGKR